MRISNRNVPTIRDVARLANVSTATVSRALSFPERVSEDTRNAVLQAVEATGYTINEMARNLRRQRTGAILVLVPNLGNAFFSRVLEGIESVVSEAGYNTLVADTELRGATGPELVAFVGNNRADGLIVLDGQVAPEVLGVGLPNRPPVVIACERIPGSGVPTVTVDNVGGAGLAIRHLIEFGHRRIAHLTGPMENILARDRLEGALSALREARLPIRPEWLLNGDFTHEAGIRAARALLAMDERPSAIFCANDGMAFGLISELYANGVRVPDELSVVGFDDIEVASIYIPALTTVRQPRAEIGRLAAERLLQQITRPGMPVQDPEPELPLSLVVRHSTAHLEATGRQAR